MHTNASTIRLERSEDHPDGITGVYQAPEGCYADESDVEEFDKAFPHK